MRFSLSRFTKWLSPVLAGIAAFVVSNTPAMATKSSESDGGGLPQFNPDSFASQIFWLFVTFALLYLYFSRMALPDMSRVLENRHEHVQGDMDEAERLSQEAQSVQKHYEERLKKARKEASQILEETKQTLKENTEQSYKDFRERYERETSEMEKRLQESKENILEDMHNVTAQAAQQAADKIAGLSISEQQARSAVEQKAKQTNYEQAA